MRLHQPIGIYLLLWPCWWSATLASSGLPSLKLLITFATGAVIMRAAGCIVNDIIDRDLDRHVERTRVRPLASGEVSVKQATALLLVLLLCALVIVLTLNFLCIALAAASLLLVAAYPFMKRITWWPQAFLGITFNWGALMGWAAVKGSIGVPSLILYLGCIFWTLGYDTIYAHQDKEDDMKIGIKSTALHFQNHNKRWIAGFYLASVICWLLTGMATGKTFLYYAGLLLAGAHFTWQIANVNIDDAKSCKKIFCSNAVLGLILFLSLCF